MKKIIRLTESDLTRIVKRVLLEQQTTTQTTTQPESGGGGQKIDFVAWNEKFPTYITSNKNVKIVPKNTRAIGNTTLEVTGSAGYNISPIYNIKCIPTQKGYDIERNKDFQPSGLFEYVNGQQKKTDNNYAGTGLDMTNKDVYNYLIQACSVYYPKKG